MSKLLLAPTEDFIKVERGTLDADAVAGTSVALTLQNNNGLAQYDYIVIGLEGNELAELEQISAAVSGNTQVTVGTLKFNHKKGEPITKYSFNKRKFYGCVTETGSYAELTGDGSPKDIQADDPQGTFLEYTGSTYLFFKATYYNSQTTTESAIADANSVSGDESLRYATIYGIRKMAGLAGNPLYSDQRIEVKRKMAESTINAALAARYVLPLTEVPALLNDICESLAAGSISYEEFGKDADGIAWIQSAKSTLKSISKGEMILMGADGLELTRQTNSGSLIGYPNNNTDVGAERVFTMADKF